MRRLVVVGGGLAGHRAAIELQKLAPEASITIIGAEPGLPYDRPPLSKNFLLGNDQEKDIILHGAEAYRQLGIEHRPSTPVLAIDRAGRRVLTGDGAWLEYDSLLLATGSRPRLLACPVPDTVEMHYLRTLADAAKLREALAADRHVIIIGGGFIGLEVASSARARGCRVTVLESRDRVLSRGMPEVLSRWVRDLHHANGVSIVVDAEVKEVVVDGTGGIVVCLSQESIRADVVMVGIGVVPNVELAAEAGLRIDDGIVVDRGCRTSDPHIFAAGEVTSHPIPKATGHHRIESWKLASEQPRVAARSMLGIDAEFSDLPWLWSDQFNMNIQALGRPDQAREYVMRGDLSSRAWTVICMGPDERPVGAVSVNNGRDISMLRRVILNGDRFSP